MSVDNHKSQTILAAYEIDDSCSSDNGNDNDNNDVILMIFLVRTDVTRPSASAQVRREAKCLRSNDDDGKMNESIISASSCFIFCSSAAFSGPASVVLFRVILCDKMSSFSRCYVWLCVCVDDALGVVALLFCFSALSSSQHFFSSPDTFSPSLCTSRKWALVLVWKTISITIKSWRWSGIALRI